MEQRLAGSGILRGDIELSAGICYNFIQDVGGAVS
jgi:hypothetical protein